MPIVLGGEAEHIHHILYIYSIYNIIYIYILYVYMYCSIHISSISSHTSHLPCERQILGDQDLVAAEISVGSSGLKLRDALLVLLS